MTIWSFSSVTVHWSRFQSGSSHPQLFLNRSPSGSHTVSHTYTVTLIHKHARRWVINHCLWLQALQLRWVFFFSFRNYPSEGKKVSWNQTSALTRPCLIRPWPKSTLTFLDYPCVGPYLRMCVCVSYRFPHEFWVMVLFKEICWI